MVRHSLTVGTLLLLLTAAGFAAEPPRTAGPVIDPASFAFNYPDPPQEGRANFFSIGVNGNARCIIVYPTDASPAVRQAANGLGAYLGLVVGDRFAVKPEDAAAPDGLGVIHVGDTAVARRTELKLPDVCYGDDAMPNLNGYLVHTPDARTLVIRGRTDAAVNHAVVGLLRRYVGVRQFWPGVPGRIGDVIPSRPDLSLPELQWRDWPYYFSRTMTMGSGTFVSGPAPLDFFRRAKTIPSGENYSQWLPRQKFAQTHPEYYSLVAGKRQIPQNDASSGWQPCCSNPEVVKAVSDGVIQFFRDNPDAVGINVSINDGGRDCQCEGCRAMDAPDGSLGDRYMKFTNQVCEQVEREFPGKSIAYLVYGGARPLPQTVKPHPMVTPVLVTGYALHSCDEWLNLEPARMGLYFHHDDDFMFVLPKLDVHRIARDLRYAAASGRARVFYMEAFPIWPVSGIVPYITAEILWDPRQDVDALLDDYYTTFFGPAAEPMKRYYQALLSGYARWMKVEGKPHPAGPDVGATMHNRVLSQFGVLTPDEAQQASIALAEAEAAAASDALVAERVRIIRWAFGVIQPAVEQYAAVQRLHDEPVHSEADARRVVNDARRALDLSRVMKEYIAETLDAEPAAAYRLFQRAQNAKHSNDMFNRLKSGVPNPEVGLAMAVGMDAAADFLRKELGPDRAAAWFRDLLSVETNPALRPVLEAAGQRAGGIELKNLVADPSFEQFGERLAPDELDPDREIVLNWDQQRTAGLHFWFPERSPYRIRLDDQVSHSGRYALTIESCHRARLARTAPAAPGERVRIGLWFRHDDGPGKYIFSLDAMGKEGVVIPLGEVKVSPRPGEWQHLQTDVVVPEGANRVNLRFYIHNQAAGERCWIDDLFIGKHPPAETTGN